MTYDDVKGEYGREPVYIVELALDFCSNTYGINNGTTSICDATGGPGEECYNTFPNCQDTVNYDAANLAINPDGPISKKIYRFSNKRIDELQQADEVPTIPSITGMEMAGTKLDPTKGLGIRSSVNVTLMDHPWSDRGTYDPYVDDRPYDPASQGSFWGKFITRNQFYEGRTIKILTGFLNPDGSYDAANFRERLYIIQRISGPDYQGVVTIEAKDPLKFADRNKAQFPPAPKATIDADINDTVTTIDYTDNNADLSTWLDIGGGNEQPYIRIDDEIMLVTGDTGSQLTVTRATMPSIYQADTNVAAEHDANASIQQCYFFDEERIDDIYYFLLNSEYGANIDAGFLPLSDWQDIIEQSGYINYIFTALIAEPKGVNEYLEELVKHNVYFFWQEREQEVKMGTLLPGEAGGVIFNEDDNVIENSITRTQDVKNQLTQVWLGYAHRNPTFDLDKDTNLTIWDVPINQTAESIAENNRSTIAKIRSRWLPRAQSAVAGEIANRTLIDRGIIKNVITLELDPKDDDQWTGDSVRVNTRLVQGADGANEELGYLILETNENLGDGTVTYSYLLRQAATFNRVGVIAPNCDPDGDGELSDGGEILTDGGELICDEPFPDYSDASETLRSRYIFIAYDHAPDPPADPASPPGFNDGTPAYQIQ